MRKTRNKNFYITVHRRKHLIPNSYCVTGKRRLPTEEVSQKSPQSFQPLSESSD